jgi:hypothetical protein
VQTCGLRCFESEVENVACGPGYNSYDEHGRGNPWAGCILGKEFDLITELGL